MSATAVVIRLALRLGRIISPRVAWWAGAGLGAAIAALPLREVRRARAHLARGYSDRDQRWARRTTRRTFRHFGRMALWTLATIHLDPRRLRRGIAVEGAEHIRAAVRAHRRGEGTIGLSGHFGNWELLARIGGTLVPLTTIGRRLRDPALDALLVAARRANGSSTIYQEDGMRPCLRALREGRMLATLPDQDIPRLAGVFVPWFGEAAWTVAGPAQLALLSGTAVMPAFLFARGGRWVMHWGPRRRWPASGDRAADVQALSAWFMAYEEALVRRHPEQWVWWHKRWRTRPAAERAG